MVAGGTVGAVAAVGGWARGGRRWGCGGGGGAPTGRVGIGVGSATAVTSGARAVSHGSLAEVNPPLERPEQRYKQVLYGAQEWGSR